MAILSTREWATLIWGLLFLIYNISQENKKKFLEGNSNIFWQEIKNIMGNNTAICPCYHDDILSFIHLGEYLH